MIVFTSYQGNKQLLLDNTSHYGNIIATQLAQNSRDAIIQRDNISLQAMLFDLAEQPQILQATVYDVQNQAVAQAGESGPGFDYSASITFQDSIAGYAVITIDATSLAGSGTLAWQLLILSMIVTGLVYASALFPARYAAKLIQQHQGGSPAANRRSSPNQKSTTGSPAPLEQTAITDCAFLHISASTLPASLAAMNESEQQALAWLKQQLMDICQLYEGQLTPLKDSSFIASFHNTDDDSYPFRALCCASLAKQLLEEQTLLECEYGLMLYQTRQQTEGLTEQECIEQAAQLASQEVGQLISDRAFIEHHSIQGRVETRPLEPDAIAITLLKEPYGSLLARQLSTLKLQQRH